MRGFRHRADDDDGFARTIFGGDPKLVLAHIEHRTQRGFALNEMKRRPGDGNLPNADSQEAPKVDDCGAHAAVSFNKHVRYAAERFARGCMNFLPHDAFEMLVIDKHCWRFRLRGRRIWQLLRRALIYGGGLVLRLGVSRIGMRDRIAASGA